MDELSVGDEKSKGNERKQAKMGMGISFENVNFTDIFNFCEWNLYEE